MSHSAVSANGSSITVNISNVPDECPQCHHKGTFSPLSLYQNSGSTEDKELEVVYRCPNFKCHEVFIGYYKKNLANNYYYLQRTDPNKYIARKFSTTIEATSADFSEIYNQALEAEHDGLDQVCGPGYRKALEFIIKDYLLGKESDEQIKETIMGEALGSCITNRIKDTNIKEVAKRAAWLGNDETHYIRKWEEKDLQDLKKLIDLTVHWMEAEALTTQLLKDMPV